MFHLKARCYEKDYPGLPLSESTVIRGELFVGRDDSRLVRTSSLPFPLRTDGKSLSTNIPELARAFPEYDNCLTLKLYDYETENHQDSTRKGLYDSRESYEPRYVEKSLSAGGVRAQTIVRDLNPCRGVR